MDHDDAPRIIEEGDPPPGSEKPPSNGGGAAPIDFEDLPETHEELHDYMGEHAIPAIAMFVRIARRLSEELATRDLSQEKLSQIMTTLGTVGKRLSDASDMIAETTPRTINAIFNFALADGKNICPCCLRDWPKDLQRDTSGFDK